MLRVKGKMGYLTRKIVEPKENDQLHGKWELENSLAILWLFTSMQPKISNGYLFAETAKYIWDAAA